MPFPTRLLASNEEVVLEVHPHWCYLGWPLVSTGAAVAISVALVVAVPSAPVQLVYVLLALVGVCALWLLGRFLRRATTTIVVTTARVVRRSGVLSRTSLEIRLERINELSCHQSVGGRVLGSGEVMVEVGGETGVVVFDHVPQPQVVQSVMSDQVSGWHRAANHPGFQPRTVRSGESDTPPTGTDSQASPSAGVAASAGDRLLQLDQLRKRGIVSEAEYEMKRQQLLREL